MFIDAEKKKIIGDTDGAIVLYKQILELDPNDDVAAYLLAKVYLQQKNYTESANYFSLALVNEKTNPWYYIHGAEAYANNDQILEASNTMENLVKQFPNEKEYYDRLEYLYHKTGQYGKQLETVNRLIDRFGYHRDYALSKIQILDQLNRQDEAIVELKKLSEENPNDKLLLNLLANFYKKQGRDEEAMAVYQSIITLDPDDADANIALHVKDNSTSSVIQKIRTLENMFSNSAIDFNSKYPHLAPFLENNLEDLDSLELQALSEASAWLLTAHPDDAKALAFRADMLVNTGNSLLAIPLYQQTIALYPDNYMVWEQLFWTLKETLKWKELLKTTDEAMIYFPNKATVYYMKAMAAYHSQKYDDALFELEFAEKLATKDRVLLSNIWALKGQILCQSDGQKSANAFAEARKILGENPNIDYRESYCVMSQPDLEQSLKLIQSAVNKVPSSPEFKVQLALVYQKMNRPDAAIETLLPLAENSVYYPVFELLSDLYRDAGNATSAKKYYDKAIKYGMPPSSSN
ncbi:hypothetical protein GCM10025777_58660 [Membranihabitans marinus]